jgi:hypothetical protein
LTLGPRIWGSQDLPDPGSSGSRDPKMTPFWYTLFSGLLGVSSHSGPKGGPKRTPKGSQNDPFDPRDLGSGGPGTPRSGVLRVSRPQNDPFLAPFWYTLFQDYWAFRATLAQKGVQKGSQKWPQNDPFDPRDPGSGGSGTSRSGVPNTQNTAFTYCLS